MHHHNHHHRITTTRGWTRVEQTQENGDQRPSCNVGVHLVRAKIPTRNQRGRKPRAPILKRGRAPRCHAAVDKNFWLGSISFDCRVALVDSWAGRNQSIKMNAGAQVLLISSAGPTAQACSSSLLPFPRIAFSLDNVKVKATASRSFLAPRSQNRNRRRAPSQPDPHLNSHLFSLVMAVLKYSKTFLRRSLALSFSSSSLNTLPVA